MSSIQFHPNELLLIYNDNHTNSVKQTRAYARSVSDHVNEVHLESTKLTTTLWKEIVNKLELKPKDLLDKSKPEYQEKIRGNEFTMEGWLEVLNHNPHLLKAPMAFYDNRAVLCVKPTDILKLDRSETSNAKIPPHLRHES